MFKWLLDLGDLLKCCIFRPRHQTKIVNGAHPGAGARIAYTRAISEHRCFPKRD